MTGEDVMQRIEFEAAQRVVFAQNGLKTFDDFITFDKGKQINRNEKRDVHILTLQGSQGECTYFMKRFFSPHPKDMLFTIRNFGRLCSQAELEWRAAHILLNNGIDTYRPACWGAQTFCGIERRSFFVTEKINGRSLIEFLLDRWESFDRPRQEKLVRELAAFFRKLHGARFSLPDSYLWHLFLIEPIGANQPYQFAIIDLHRMQLNAAASRHAARNLGALLFSLPDEWFDARLRELFIDTYLESDNGDTAIADRRMFLDTLEKRQQTLIARRGKPGLERLKKLA